MNDVIVSLDPGGTTGVAILSASPFINSSPLWERRQLGPEDHHKALWDLLMTRQLYAIERAMRFTIVCESFDFRIMDNDRTGTVLVSREYIGVVKLFHAMNHAPVVMQTPGAGKMGSRTFVRREHLQKLGLYQPSNRHAMDATAHLLYYIIHSGKYQTDSYRKELLERAWK